jgi:hypothetical protein
VRRDDVDLERALYVIAMFVVHVARLVPLPVAAAERERGSLARAALDACLDAEPLIAAGFLGLVGTSVVLRQQGLARTGAPSDPLPWRRAASLYAIAIALFALQYGLAWPDLVLAPGVLSAIAWALLITYVAERSRAPAWAQAGVFTAVLAVAFALEGSGRTVSGLNGGPGGAVPLVAFAAWGALVTRGVVRWGERRRALVLLGALLLSVGLGLAQLPWTTLETSTYPDYGGETAALGMLRGAPVGAEPITFWNHSVVGTLGLLGPLLAVRVLATRLTALRAHAARIVASRRVPPPSAEVRPGVLVQLGRHALFAYVGHLLGLGLVSASGAGPASAAAALIWVALLVAVFAVLGPRVSRAAAYLRG